MQRKLADEAARAYEKSLRAAHERISDLELELSVHTHKPNAIVGNEESAW